MSVYVEHPSDAAFTAFLAALTPSRVLRDRERSFTLVERKRQRFLREKAALEREDFAAKFKREGQQRAAMTTCMTCWQRYGWTVNMQVDWKHSPSSVIGRECQRLEYRTGYGADKTDNQLDKEFRALAALVEAHRAEFDGYMAGIENTVSLSEWRTNRKQETIIGRIGPRPL